MQWKQMKGSPSPHAQQDLHVEIDEDSKNLEEKPLARTGREKDAIRHTQKHGHPPSLVHYHNGQNGRSGDYSLQTRKDPKTTEHRDNAPCLINLDNTLRLINNLNHNMTLEEATKSVGNFDCWFEWNEEIQNNTSSIQRRILLENSLNANMLSKLQKDKPVTKETAIRGSDNLLAILRGYFIKQT